MSTLTSPRFDVSTFPASSEAEKSDKPRKVLQTYTPPGGQTVFRFGEYRNAGGRYYTLFWHESKRRMRQCRSSLKALKKLAAEIDTRISNGFAGFDHATPEDFARLRHIEDQEHKIGETAEVILAERAEARRIAPDIGQIEAARFWRDSHPAGQVTKLCPDLVTELIRKMETDKAGQRWIDDLDSRLGVFSKAFVCPVHELRAPAITNWLEALEVGPRSRNNYRVALLALVAYAKSRGYLPKAWSEMDEVPRAKQQPVQVRIYTPENLTALLANARPNLIPFLAIQAFAGVRHEEITGGQDSNGTGKALDWRDIHLDQRLIYVPGPVAKSGTPDRLVPISDNLVAWLTPHAKRNGPICQLANVSNATRHTADRCRPPVQLLHNALRKSFISYRLALVKNIGQVAEEAGNSPQVIKSNYRRPIPDTEAKRWFDIYPSTGSILQLNFKLG